MNFHAQVSDNTPLALPVALAHFVPWFTIRGDDFPLHSDDARTLDWIPELEDMRHWHDARAGYRRTHLHMPTHGTYDSRDPKLIRQQIEDAQAHGIDGFIVNWYGKYSMENVITLHWLRELNTWNAKHASSPFYYMLSLDSQMQMDTEGKRPVSMAEDFTYIRDTLINDAYLLRDGRPVFSVFPYEDNCHAWITSAAQVWGEDAVDFIWMNSAPGQGEQAAYPWVMPDRNTIDLSSTHTWSDPDSPGTGWLRDFYGDANAAKLDYVMGGVWPGFDDQLVTWAWNPEAEKKKLKPRVICRETSLGNTLELTWQVYIDYLSKWKAGDPSCKLPAPLVQLITWNDYAEASALEPTADYGTQPLETCKRFIKEARAIWSGE